MASLTVLALGLAACGGDDDDDSGNGGNGSEPTAASDATKTGEQPTSSPGRTTEATRPPATSASEDSNSVFDRLAADSITKTYQAKYNVEFESSGQKQTGTATIASKPPKLASIINLTVAGAGEFAISVIDDGTTSYTCSNFGAGGRCSKDDSSLGTGGVDVKKAIDEARKGNDVKELPKQTIAGRNARCFEAKDAATSTTSSFCLDEKDSIMLSFQTSGVKMTATEVKTSVDEKLFELPFPVS